MIQKMYQSLHKRYKNQVQKQLAAISIEILLKCSYKEKLLPQQLIFLFPESV